MQYACPPSPPSDIWSAENGGWRVCSNTHIALYGNVCMSAYQLFTEILTHRDGMCPIAQSKLDFLLSRLGNIFCFSLVASIFMALIEYLTAILKEISSSQMMNRCYILIFDGAIESIFQLKRSSTNTSNSELYVFYEISLYKLFRLSSSCFKQILPKLRM